MKKNLFNGHFLLFKEYPILITVLALICKFAISFTYSGIYIIVVEIYPTVIRNSSVSLNSVIARFGSVIAPNIQLLVTINIVFVFICLLLISYPRN